MRGILLIAGLLVCLLAALPCLAAEAPTTIQAIQMTSVAADQPLELSTNEMAAVTGEHGTVICGVSSPATAQLAVWVLGGRNNWRGAHIHVVKPFNWRSGGAYDIAVLR